MLTIVHFSIGMLTIVHFSIGMLIIVHFSPTHSHQRESGHTHTVLVPLEVHFVVGLPFEQTGYGGAGARGIAGNCR